MTTLLLVRHGESTANLQDLFAGHYDPELTELGHRQAERTARFVLENYRVDAVYSSDLHRAYDTARHFGEMAGLQVQKEPRLREIFAGAWEAVPFSVVEEKYAADWDMWRTDPANAVCTDGEAFRHVADRVYEALTDIAKNNEGKTVLVASHATPLRVAMWKVGGGDPEALKAISWVSNASVTELHFDGSRFSLGKVSQDAHLGELRTVLNVNI